ncbi:MAG TPA: response regulator transcription factor [Steroidobacteraceae bacterium]|nr:response regulator transcription factor [Steroidobacteraceae bacterium]
MTDTIKVLLVDDHPVVRAGYRHLLQMDAQIEVVAEANDSASACEAFRVFAPDVVVMDISLPGASGLEAMKRMRSHRPSARVLIFSMHDEAIFVSRAERSGAAGFLSKSSAPERLIDVVRTVARGERYVSNPPAGRTTSRIGHAASAARLNDLSQREAETLHLWSKAYSLDEIGAQLGISQKTVANHLSCVRQKLGVQNDVQLLRTAERFWSSRE